ncbi:uncharacterized protein LOC129586854 [Paramacrobiotus metropolitanus]|uniref:uncharacterized protein LOC129586854 n=1 Tax=Paramacrobiotus metropolitanus TaxID=2943436 RepID=UPI00244611AF|nr:uncharacterized protein LOC129586854 [Paramacrobiotus metropolitanus]
MAKDLKSILNHRIQLSVIIDENSFDRQFANGYLFGEMLSKFGLQPDFPFIRNSDDLETKIHNYSRILPALEDIDMKINLSDIVQIINAKAGSAALLVYNVLKALKVLPIKNPRWTIEKAERFHRKGKWADFIAGTNMDFDTFTQLTNKYEIPGEERCRYFRDALNAENERRLQKDSHLTASPRTGPALAQDSSNWRLKVQTELDEFDNNNQPIPNNKAKAGDVVPIAPAVASPIPTSAASVLSTRSQISPTSDITRTVKSAESVSIVPPREPLHSQNTPDDSALLKEITAGIEITPPSATDLPPYSPANLAEFVPPKRKKSKQSLTFNRDEYMRNIHRKAEERKQQKLSLEKEQQELWLNSLVEKRKLREQETEIATINRINARIEHDRKIALAHLINRRSEFDTKVQEAHLNAEMDKLRQMEYVRTMLNQGFWDFEDEGILTMDNVQEWCRKAEIPFNQNFYDNICKNYKSCRELLAEAYHDTYVKSPEPAADVDPAEPPQPETEVTTDDHSSENTAAEIPETQSQETDQPDNDPPHITDRPTLFWENQEFEQYQEITTQFPYEHLSWMQRFINASKINKRNLGHIISCVINDPTWRQPTVQTPRFSTKFISIFIAGRRLSLLKKTILHKLALTYNLEIISLADLLHEAVETALALQIEVPETKDPKATQKRRLSKGPMKKASISKLRSKTKSVAASASALNTGWLSPGSQKDEFSRRLLRSLSEDAAIEPAVIVDLLEQAIENHVVHPVQNTVDPFNDAVSLGTTSTKKGGRGESKSRTEENNPAREKPADEVQPFGWVVTDLPNSTELLQLIEQRLGGCSLDIHPTHWQSSKLIPDDYGQKPREFPRSFFSAILCVDCPEENDLLHPEKHTDPPPLEEDRVVTDSAQHSPSKPKNKHNTPGHAPVTTVQEDAEEIFNPPEIRRHLTEFLNTLDQLDETQWKGVETFYSRFLMKVFGRLANWKNPEETYSLIAKTVEDVMESNTIMHTDGVSLPVQQQLNQTIQEVCDRVWNYREGIRRQVAENMLGSPLAASAIHYLFKQDIKLVRDVYCKCQAKLYHIARQRQGMRHHIAIALYRNTTFPLKRNHQRLAQIMEKNRSNPQEKPASNRNRSSCLEDRVIYDASSKNFPTFHTVEEMEKELLRMKRGAHGSHHRPETGPLTQDEEAFLRQWLEEAIPQYLPTISQFHRRNELVLSVIDLHPSNSPPIIYHFPYLNTDNFTHIQEAWNSIENAFIEQISQIIPTMNMVDIHLAHNTKHNQQLFTSCLSMPNATSINLMKEYVMNYDRNVQKYPDIRAAQTDKRKLKDLYLKLCKIADYRHAARHDFVRDLMKNSGYTDVVYKYRNTHISLILAEIELFQNILLFLGQCYNSILPHSTEFPQTFRKPILPLHAVTGEQTQRAEEILRRVCLEAPMDFCLGMACGSFQQELCDFVDIVSDDKAYWEQMLQIIRFFLDEVAQRVTHKIKHCKIDTPKENPTDDAKESPQNEDESENTKDTIPENISAEYSNESEKSDTEMEHRKTARLVHKLLESKTIPDENGTDTSSSWFEEFKKYDYDEFISTVKHDIAEMQEQHRDAALDSGDGQPEVDEVEVANAMQRTRKLKKIVTETVIQEVDYTMLRVCRITVACIRKCEAVRNTAKETFCVMDHWLQDAHRKEQYLADEFYQSILAIINSSQNQQLLSDNKIKEIIGDFVWDTDK